MPAGGGGARKSRNKKGRTGREETAMNGKAISTVKAATAEWKKAGDNWRGRDLWVFDK